MTADAACRSCGAPLTRTFVDLGMSPLANAFVKAGDLNRMEPFYPLHPRVCESCLLVQLPELERPERIFGEYAYFSSYSESWLRHAQDFAGAMQERLGLDGDALVVEIASNDGYLLRYFTALGIPVLGIEPAGNVARAAREQGIPTRVEFFGAAVGRELADDGRRADLVIANNVIAHVPALNDFVQGMKTVLKPGGVITLEFPHLMALLREGQFDTIYHEHFSYFSFFSLEKVLARHGLSVFDVDRLSTHGGSLRVYAQHQEGAGHPVSERVAALTDEEARFGIHGLNAYTDFARRVRETKRALLRFLVEAKQQGAAIVGYGAPAKGNTLLNYCGIGTDFLDYTVDRSPHKQGLYLPGTHIPIYPPERIFETRPDYVLILPWNLRDEITAQLAGVGRWGGRCVVPIPRLEVLA